MRGRVVILGFLVFLASPGHAERIKYGCNDLMAKISQRAIHALKKELHRKFPGSDNLHFKQLATGGRTDLRFLYVEAQSLKRLNDRTFRDKELSAATIVHFKKIFGAQLNDKGLLPQAVYADYKGLRLATDTHSKTDKSVRMLYKQATKQFAEELPSLFAHRTALTPAEVRRWLEGPRSWFLAGSGSTAAQAAAAARYARDAVGNPDWPQSIVSFHHPKVFSAIHQRMWRAEILRRKLVRMASHLPPTQPPLTEKVDGVEVPSYTMMVTLREAMGLPETLRHSYLAAVLESRFGIDSTPKGVSQLLEFYELVSAISPSLYMDEETHELGLSKPTNFIAAMDIVGQGARNMQQAMVVLANQTKNSKSDLPMNKRAKWVSHALTALDRGQITASADFKKRVETYQKALVGAVGNENQSVLSGDENIYRSDSPFSSFQIGEILGSINRSDYPDSHRQIFLPTRYENTQLNMDPSLHSRYLEMADRALHKLKFELERKTPKDQLADLNKLSMAIHLAPYQRANSQVTFFLVGPQNMVELAESIIPRILPANLTLKAVIKASR